MLMIRALRNRAIALLWGGQAASAIGDEIYRMALIWIAIGLVGTETGYLAAGQMAALLTLSLLGGKWADHWDHFRTMIWVDSLRALIVCLPVVLIHFMPLSMTILWVVALSLSSLSAFFDPAVQAMIPRFCPDLPTLRAANGLMSTTLRLARVAGPGIVGVCVLFLPTIHFFTLDAITFVISAFSIVALQKQTPARHFARKTEIKKMGFRESVISGFHAIEHSKKMRFIIFAKALTGGSWSLGYSLGLALMVHEIAPHDVRAFGAVIGAYGVGNLGAALYFGNTARTKSYFLMFSGYVCLGVGFVLIALAPNLPLMMLASAIAAIGGPLNDLPFADIVQASFPIEEIAKVFRLRMALETAAMLVAMVFSPFLFRLFPIHTVIAWSGVFTLAIGAAGLIQYNDLSGGQSTSATEVDLKVS
jgi:DHA3 family macrolide efflux protein-like MFS transporter